MMNRSVSTGVLAFVVSGSLCGGAFVSLWGAPAAAQTSQTHGAAGLDPALAPPTNSLRSRAEAQVAQSLESSDPYMRANAIEASGDIVSPDLSRLALALEDESTPVRFAALMVIGDRRIVAMSAMADIRLDDDQPSVRAAAIYASVRTGGIADASSLSGLAMSPNPQIRNNAYLMIGRMGNRSAVPMLQEVGGLPLNSSVSPTLAGITQVQLAETLYRLGDGDVRSEALQVIRAAMFEKDPELNVFATSIYGRLGDRSYGAALSAMVNAWGNPDIRDVPPELAIAAAVSLAEIGAASGLDVLLEAAESQSTTWQGQTYSTEGWRSQAAFGLARINDPRAVAALESLLQDPIEQVRLAAAGAILRAARNG